MCGNTEKKFKEYRFSGTEEEVSKVGAWLEKQGYTLMAHDLPVVKRLVAAYADGDYRYLNWAEKSTGFTESELDDILNPWLKNNGMQPLDLAGHTLEVKLNVGAIGDNTLSGSWRWSITGSDGDISHYRFRPIPGYVAPANSSSEVEKRENYEKSFEVAFAAVAESLKPRIQATTILSDAATTIGQRAIERDKGDSERSMHATVQAFNALTKHTLTEEQGWLFMVVLKAARSQGGQFKLDDYLDGAAYFALAGEAAGNV